MKFLPLCFSANLYADLHVSQAWCTEPLQALHLLETILSQSQHVKEMSVFKRRHKASLVDLMQLVVQDCYRRLQNKRQTS